MSAGYGASFASWCRDNMHVVDRFFAEADAVWERGLRHYSARTIIEFLRHETTLREAGNAERKLNNNAVPDLARLYMNVTGRALFELRVRRVPVICAE